MSPATQLLPLWFMAALVAAAVAAVLVRYAHRIAPIDAPVRHSSHTRATPRGGGVGIALALVGSLAAMQADGGSTIVLACLLAVALVAVVGFVDDHRGLGIAARLLAHFAAAATIALAFMPVLGATGWLAAAVLAIALVWSINLHNFMDGADGLLSLQALFVLGTLAALALAGRGHEYLAAFAGSGAAATLAFLPFNFPRARIFLGDAGSGTLGLAIGIALLVAVLGNLLNAGAALILPSAFLLDATLTLASRFLRGRRWHARHREHLYQWLIRSGWSHARVVLAYAAWNLALALPAALFARTLEPVASLLACAVVYVVGATIWLLTRPALLRRLRR